MWYNESRQQTKLAFYASLKSKFIAENYISIKNAEHRIALTRFRISAHKLGIETGRYSNKPDHIKKFDKACTFCTTIDSSVMELLCELPIVDPIDPILEDEIHFIKNCPTYNHIRNNLSSDLLSKINHDEYSSIFESNTLTNEFAKFIFLATKYRLDQIKSRSNKITTQP